MIGGDYRSDDASRFLEQCRSGKRVQAVVIMAAVEVVKVMAVNINGVSGGGGGGGGGVVVVVVVMLLLWWW